jgi:hypothetical protein
MLLLPSDPFYEHISIILLLFFGQFSACQYAVPLIKTSPGSMYLFRAVQEILDGHLVCHT